MTIDNRRRAAGDRRRRRARCSAGGRTPIGAYKKEESLVGRRSVFANGPRRTDSKKPAISDFPRSNPAASVTMKVYAVVLAVFVVGAYSATLNDEQKGKLREFKEACITESGVDKEIIEGVVKGGPLPTRDNKIDCFSACMLKKIGIMREDGTIDAEAAHAKAANTNVDMAKAKEVIDKCKDLKGKDTCETGGAVFSCFIENKEFPVLD